MSNTILTGEAAADILAAMQKAGLNGWEMFSECRHLKNVYIPAGVKYIEADVFYGCDALKNVCFGADLAAMQAIRIGEGNEALSKAVLRCGILNKPETGEK